ncbi:MAG: amidase [Chloroflexi bacterium]|nr:amidase [Chloroflexota bacterium]
MAEQSISELQAALRAGELSAAQLVTSYLQRIRELDQAGPGLNAVIELNPDALAAAQALDAERQVGRLRGPLHGIPVLLKDNIDTGDRMATTAGSLALEGSRAPRDAGLVERLRAAGAIILGKTNLSEWASFRSTHSTSGWSSRGGLTRNPYALDRNPCGSSSGSAVAVAADLCAAAVGTETDGSIICPSSVNGIVGLKPTLGLISRSGIIPIAHSQDTAGPMGRTVRDVAILLGALAGPDPRDPATRETASWAGADYERYLDPDGLRGARIGVVRGYWGRHPAVDRVMEEALAALRGLGAVLIDPVEIATVKQLGAHEHTVLLHEFRADLNDYLSTRGPGVPVRSLREVIAFNEQHRARTMPYFGQELLLQAESQGPLTTPQYLEALTAARRLARDEGLDAALRSHRLDALVAPSNHPAHLTDLVNGDCGSGGSSSPAAVAGYPSITVPAGYVFGLPVGLSLMAGAYAEPTLLRLTYAYEQATHVRIPPAFRPSAPLEA